MAPDSPFNKIIILLPTALFSSHFLFIIFFFTANHDKKAPILCTAFSSDGGTIFSGRTDKAVCLWQLQTRTPSPQVAPQIGAHDAPVKCVRFLPTTRMVVSGGWDKKLKFWDACQPIWSVLDMPERVHAMDVRSNLMVVTTTDHQILSYDVGGQPHECSQQESPLKYQTQCITAFPDQTGFAVGCIEGRVGIHYLQKVPGKKSLKVS